MPREEKDEMMQSRALLDSCSQRVVGMCFGGGEGEV